MSRLDSWDVPTTYQEDSWFCENDMGDGEAICHKLKNEIDSTTILAVLEDLGAEDPFVQYATDHNEVYVDFRYTMHSGNKKQFSWKTTATSYSLRNVNGIMACVVGLNISETFRGKGLYALLHEHKKSVARLLGVKTLLATVEDTNSIEQHLLDTFNWERLTMTPGFGDHSLTLAMTRL